MKDFRDICEKFYKNRELEIDIIERDTLEKNTGFICKRLDLFYLTLQNS